MQKKKIGNRRDMTSGLKKGSKMAQENPERI